VLAALGSELMRSELVAAFVAEFTAEWNRLRAQASAGLAGKRAELDRVRAQLERLEDALTEGAPVSSVRSRMETLEARQAALEAEVEAAGKVGELPRLHGNLAEVYRERVERLREALSAEGGPEIVEAIRTLIERVEVHPAPEVPRRHGSSWWGTWHRCCGPRAGRPPRTQKTRWRWPTGLMYS